MVYDSSQKQLDDFLGIKPTMKSLNSAINAAILAGGSGSRLWPLSRKHIPKQFLRIEGNDTMLDATVSRVKSVCPDADVLIVASSQHSNGEAYQALKEYNTLCEPVGRNTAPAIALAASFLLQQAEIDPLMVVLPADHIIQNLTGFKEALNQALFLAEQGHLVTFGVVPTTPDTGFGYIKAAEGFGGDKASLVECFKEKPSKELAIDYVNSGSYFWNSGMFVWRASEILTHIRQFLPEIDDVISTIELDCTSGKDYQRAVNDYFSRMPDISIDYGVLEKIASQQDKLMVVPCDLKWNDVGSWDAVYQISDKDEQGNVLSGNVMAIDCQNNLLKSNHRLVAAVGVDDVCLVETPDAILLTKRGESQRVREVVNELNLRNAQEHMLHLTVNRPWGSYTILEEQPGYKMKRITVNPGASLSLQRHQHRSEHWVVVSGTATVTCDDVVTTVTKNQSTYIPVGGVHRLENRGKIDVQLIEVQVGEYLGEDDIERYDDIYGRNDAE